jgi:hypothetical protein
MPNRARSFWACLAEHMTGQRRRLLAREAWLDPMQEAASPLPQWQVILSNVFVEMINAETPEAAIHSAKARVRVPAATEQWVISVIRSNSAASREGSL